MSDLKERLRAWADAGDMGRAPDPSDMRREAADRIEALEGALQRIAHETRRQQLPITALVNDIATQAILSQGGE